MYENLSLIIRKTLKNLDKFATKEKRLHIIGWKNLESLEFSGIYFVEMSGNANGILLGLGEFL